MQYILSEKEYLDLVAAPHKVQDGNNKILQELCTKIANEVSIKYWGREEAEPWGCMITVAEPSDEEPFGEEWYCDECPAQKHCPYEHKDWSK